MKSESFETLPAGEPDNEKQHSLQTEIDGNSNESIVPNWYKMCNSSVLSLELLPILEFKKFKNDISYYFSQEGGLAGCFAVPIKSLGSIGKHSKITNALQTTSDTLDPIYLLAVALKVRREGALLLAATIISNSYPSLSVDLPAFHIFEREIYEQFGIQPIGHPWLKPVRFLHKTRSKNDNKQNQLTQNLEQSIGIMDYFSIEDEGVHEVAVGPVHAGVIEPGHFRFQCFGEEVLHLEISLGYQHRGVEKELLGGPYKRTLFQIETIAGDTTIGHVTAYCQIMESMLNIPVSIRDQIMRGIALELERVANHTGDLGALAHDVGFLPTASYCGRLRGEFLNRTASWCGNRFGRSLVIPGGLRFDLTEKKRQLIQKDWEKVVRDVHNACECLFASAIVQSRFEGVGEITEADCRKFDFVGMVARSTGLEWDVRSDFPDGLWRFVQIPVAIVSSGDVQSRAYLRWLEVRRSLEMIQSQLEFLGSVNDISVNEIEETRTSSQLSSRSLNELQTLPAHHLAISMVEGWRGEICHIAITNDEGKFACYKIFDPSFRNWFALSLSLRNQTISDFPLCNKSFNLSYCGHDL